MREICLNNGVAMPVLGFGTYRLEGGDCQKAVEGALAAGYRLVDTAASYLNEDATGAALAASGIARRELFIVSKLWLNNASASGARRGLEGSLKRLGLDCLDLFLIHMPWGDWHTAWDELEKCQGEGLCRAIGVSNFSPDRVAELAGFHRVAPAVDQLELNLSCQRREWLAWLRGKGVVPQAWAPLGRGAGAILENPLVRDMAARHGATPAQIALAFLFAEGAAVVVQSRDPQRLAENLAARDIELAGEELAALRTLDRGGAAFLDMHDPATVEKFCAAARPSPADLLRAARAARARRREQ